MLLLLTLLASQTGPPDAPSSEPGAPSSEPAPSVEAIATPPEGASTAPAAAPQEPAPAAPASATAAPAVQESCTLAVLDLEAGEGMAKPRAVALSDVITGEVGALSGCSVLSRADVRGVLSFEAEKQLLGCSSDSSCLAELAGALGADLLVTGSVSKIGNSMLLSLRMTDLKQLRVVRRATDTFAGADEQAIPFVAWVARKLMTDDVEKLGPKPIAVAAGAAGPEKRGTVWGTLAWTGVILTGVAGGFTALAGGTTFGLSEYTREVKEAEPFVDVTTLETLESYGTLAADATNIGIYATAGLLLVTMPFFLLPHTEAVEAPEAGGAP